MRAEFALLVGPKACSRISCMVLGFRVCLNSYEQTGTGSSARPQGQRLDTQQQQAGREASWLKAEKSQEGEKGKRVVKVKIGRQDPGGESETFLVKTNLKRQKCND
jgi:hypothetical protein